MKNHLFLSFSLALTLTSFVASAQPGPPGGMGGGGPDFGGSMSKLFGDNKQFSATLELQAKDGRAGDSTIPGQLSFDNGKSRFEMNLGKMKNSNMPPGAAEQMKAMGIDSMVVVARPDQKVNYMVYPGMNAYAEMPRAESDSTTKPEDYKVEATELGKETVAGHECIKNKVVVTDSKGEKHESMVWNATDLNKFPIKIELEERGTKITMNFSDVKLKQPAASLFDAPAGATKYGTVMELMQKEMMKKMGGPGGFKVPKE